VTAQHKELFDFTPHRTAELWMGTSRVESTTSLLKSRARAVTQVTFRVAVPRFAKASISFGVLPASWLSNLLQANKTV
jgi:hypothetical protein